MSWTHTVGGGTGRGLIVGVSQTTGQGTIQSVTYGGTALTSLGSETQNGVEMSMWWLDSPPTGTATITVTTNGSVKLAAGAASFIGLSSSPLGSFVTNRGKSTAPSVSVSLLSLSNQVMVDTVASDGNAVPMSPGSGQTQLWNDTTGAGSGGEIAGGGSTKPMSLLLNSMSWRLASSRDWAIGALILNARC